MADSVLSGLSIIIVAGIGAQWLAWRLRIPSIIFLLGLGVIIGPVLGLLDPDKLFGDLLIPLVSLSVGVVLFEGGLSLRLKELTGGGGRAVFSLVSVGLAITWLLSAFFAYLVLGLHPGIALLFGAIIVVTGPTVTGPLLRQIRPVAKVNSVLKWEGIVIDPLAVLLSVVVLDVVLSGELEGAPAAAVLFVLKALGIGVVLGGAAAYLLIRLLKRYWIPDHLQSTVALMGAIGAFTASEILLPEAGLLTVTLMGVIMANQKSVIVQRITEFNEGLRVLLIGGLFLILAARIKLDDLAEFGLPMLVFLAALIFLVRPLAVFFSTWRQGFTRNERLLMAWMAPRGIVAAAISSVFALALTEVGYTQAESLGRIPER